jgi:hypothetical protein
MANQSNLELEIQKYGTTLIRKLSERFNFPYEEAVGILYEDSPQIVTPVVSAHKKSEDEEVNLQIICDHINNNTPCGQKIKAAWCKANPGQKCFDKIIIHGGCGKKYDLELIWSEEDRHETCECKNSVTKKPIDDTKSPWSNAVQGLNGIGSHYSIGHAYARHCYEALDEIISHYQLTTPKPSYEEWIKDAFKMGPPTTPFVRELRDKSNKGYAGSYLAETIRIKYNKTFIISKEQLEVLKEEVFTQANKAFAQKDHWLQINGPMNEPDDFEIRWSGKFTVPTITSIQQFKSRGNSDCDINFSLTCSNGQIFKPKLRWGYGQFITNIRLDTK